MDSFLSAKLTGRVNIAPQRSQIAVVVVFGLSLAGFAVTSLFLWHEKSHAWVPSLFTILSLLGGGWMWSRSHDQEAESTKVTVKAGSLDVQTPATTFTNQEVFARFHEMLSVLAHRKPLPSPDGLVDSAFQPIANSQSLAKSLALSVNEQGADLQKQGLEALSTRSAEPLRRLYHADGKTRSASRSRPKLSAEPDVQQQTS